MIRWTPTTPPPAPRRWQSRAEILKAHLDSLSPLELLRVRPDYYAMTYGWDFKNRRYAQGRLALYEALEERAGFNPNQPRVPAGNPDSGQWMSGGDEGGGTAGDGRAVFIDAGGASGDGAFDSISPGFQQVASTVTIDYSRALTGISRIDDTTKALSQTLAKVMETMDFIPEWTPQQYGTAVHVAFGTVVRFQGLTGIGPNDVEHSFGGDYGEPGSIRTDVVLRNDAGNVITIYDVKTGGATLTAARVRELREKTGVGSSVPIIEMHVLRGARLKARIGSRRSVGAVLTRLWNPAHRGSSI